MLQGKKKHLHRIILGLLITVLIIGSIGTASAKNDVDVESQYTLSKNFENTLSLSGNDFILPGERERLRIVSKIITDLMQLSGNKDVLMAVSGAIEKNRVFFSIEGTGRSSYEFMSLPYLIVYLFGYKDLIMVAGNIRPYDVPSTNMWAQFGFGYEGPISDWTKWRDFKSIRSDDILAYLKSEENEAFESIIKAIPLLPKQNRTIKIRDDSHVIFTTQKIKLVVDIARNTFDAPARTRLLWSSDDPQVASVNSNGEVIGKSSGITRINCYASDDKEVNSSIEIEVREAVKSIKIHQKNIKLLLSKNRDFAKSSVRYEIVPDNAYIQTVKWSTSDDKIVTVDELGNIEAVGEGSARIYLNSDDPIFKKTLICSVSVAQAVESIAFDSIPEILYVGKNERLQVIVSPSNAKNKKLKWVSSDISLASVSQAGVIHPKKPGVVVVSCITQDGSGLIVEQEMVVAK